MANMEELKFGQKVIIKLDGIQHNKNGQSAVPNPIQNPLISERPIATRLSTTNISVVHNLISPLNPCKPVVIKHETISGNHTTHFQTSTHRVEHINRQMKSPPSSSSLRPTQGSTSNSAHSAASNYNRRPLLQSRVEKIKTQSTPLKSGFVRKNGKTRVRRPEHSKPSKKRTLVSSKKRTEDSSDEGETDSYSDDGFNEETADQELLKTVKRALLDYIEVKPSKKLKSGELTWTEFKPYMENMHLPQFKAYLRDVNIVAPENMASRCIRDLHISRRDCLLKKLRKEREERSREMLEDVDPDEAGADGYTSYHRRGAH